MKTKCKAVMVVFLALIMIMPMGMEVLGVSDEPLKVFVNGTGVNFPDAEPFIDGQSRVQVPVRPICEALGAELDWNEKTQTVTITRNGTVVKLVIGSDTIDINGTEKKMDTAAVIRQNRTYVPVRFVSEAFGGIVKWVDELNLIIITAVSVGREGDGDPECLAEFEANHAALASEITMHIINSAGAIPNNINDIVQIILYVDGTDGALNSPEGASYNISMFDAVLTSQYQGYVLEWDPSHDMEDIISYVRFKVNHNTLVYAVSTYKADNGGTAPQGLDDLASYVATDIDNLLNFPKGATYDIDFDNSTLTSRYQDTILEFKY